MLERILSHFRPTPKTVVPKAASHDLDEVLASAVAGLDGVLRGTLEQSLTCQLSDREQFSRALSELVRTYLSVHEGKKIVVAPEYSQHWGLWLRVYCSPIERLKGPRKEQLEQAQSAMEGVCRRNGLKVAAADDRWFEIRFPNSSKPKASTREMFPDIPRDDWEEFYRRAMLETTHEGLCYRALRFAAHADKVARWASSEGYKSVLCPAVGICIDPWIFADHGFQVHAQDLSPTAIEVVSKAHEHPLLYSRAARDRYEALECCGWADNNPPMTMPATPDLGNEALFGRLSERVSFSSGRQQQLELGDDSVDVLFACNALPRTSPRDRRAVLDEWFRVLKPRGFAFISMHNGYDIVREVDLYFSERDWDAIAVSGWRVAELSDEARVGHGRFQAYGSSG